MKKIYLSFLLFFCYSIAFSQTQKCATVQHWEKVKQIDPQAQERMNQLNAFMEEWTRNHSGSRGGIITIPVVVHVVYNTSEQNISDDQIYSQIDVLNEDFRLQNSDALDNTHPFYPYTADAGIEFCLAQQDPDGNPTDGITRTSTDVVAFADPDMDFVKSTDDGGIDNWDPTQYLNLWVCNLEGTTLGYAAFPSELSTNPELDGVVIRYEAFGTEGTAGSGDFGVNDLGRTGSHEVGHWLNLFHIWGDDQCGDDQVSDTPTAEGDNYGCPNFPHRANNLCGSDDDGEMYMNYMDYVDDNCMNMFTEGQADRMWAALNSERSGILNSIGCQSVSIDENILFTKSIQVFPNPASNQFSVSSNSGLIKGVDIIDALGRVVAKHSANTTSVIINTSSLNNGLYTLRVWNNENVGYKNIVLL